MNASILAIGTEVTTGQIADSHSQWISQRLETLGILVSYHVAVPDEPSAILLALDFVSTSSNFVCVTGGLGPTRDDITRDVVAKWLRLSLELDDDHWRSLEAKIRGRGVQVSPGHKNQSRFPKGARILENPVGSADGFYVGANGKHVVVLPGPVAEMRGTWDKNLPAILASLGASPNQKLFTWRTVGLPESEVADLVETALEGCSNQVGFRLVSPFVETKLWIPTNEHGQKWISSVDEALGHWVFERNDENRAVHFLAVVSGMKLLVVDALTNGYLFSRLRSSATSEKKSEMDPGENRKGHPPQDKPRKDPKEIQRKIQKDNRAMVTFVEGHLDTKKVESDYDSILRLTPEKKENSALVEFQKSGGSKIEKNLSLDSRVKVRPEYAKKALAEMALQCLVTEIGG